MARQNNAAILHRADGRKQRSLITRRIGDARKGHLQSGQISFDKVDQRQIGFLAFRIKGNQLRQKLNNFAQTRLSLAHHEQPYGSIENAFGIGGIEREGRNIDIKLVSLVIQHAIGAHHNA